MGHRLTRRPVEALAQLRPPHLDERARQGSGHRLLGVADQPEQHWHPIYLAQPFYNALLALFFEYGIAIYDLELERIPSGRKDPKEALAQLRAVAAKIRRQIVKDYVAFPLLAGPAFLPVLLGNMTANLARNVWAHTIIFCGHFPEGAEVFTEDRLEGETRGEWYVRQLLGSCNIDGGRLFHIMSGNLSHQIEHHLFPDLPSNRYAEIAPRSAPCASGSACRTRPDRWPGRRARSDRVSN